MKIKVGAEIG